ncbi:peroxidase [Musa troglodytarum]|uniref:Peroxidase n=1 Tax=Musa troglodytarum TaxID=320322 RepID=A0A9E7JKA1_9LILI|nr:peroxidase [Musa troglodytarum]
MYVAVYIRGSKGSFCWPTRRLAEMKTASFLLLLAMAMAVGSCARCQAAGLKKGFYKKTCPQAEETVRSIVGKHASADSELPAKLLRLFFHDCFVRGCDASILIESTADNTAEKDAGPNLSLAGFDVIEEVKTSLETACPGTVSCADIVALAARDSVSLQFGKLLWKVKTGRRDGTISRQSEALSDLPSPASNFSVLAGQFAGKGLHVDDLVVLSGAHTIGVGHCNLFSQRLYNFTGRNAADDADPSLDPAYAALLKTKCRSLADNTTTVAMDPGSSTEFDSHYYANLRERRGLFVSDAALLTDRRSAKLVGKLLRPGDFFDAFKNSITRMGAIGVLTGTAGEIRNKCSVVNS